MKTAKIILGWTLVGVPLIYGVTQTLIKVTALFG